MYLLSIVVYLSYAVLFLFCTLCVACGLYYLAELVEEYTQLSKRILRDTILFVLVLHLLLLVFEDFPALLTLMGLLSHATYFTLLRTFPFIYVTDPKFIASCLLAVASHILWFRHFTSTDVFYPFSEILAFFLFCVWLVPFGFFVSLSANESALPQAGEERLKMSQSQGSLLTDNIGSGGKASHSLVRRIFDYVTHSLSAVVPERFTSSSERKVF